MKIELLADHRELLATLAEWYAREWNPYYGPDGPGNAKADLASRCNSDSIPIGLIALHHDRPMGVVALDVDAATALTPSVVGLLVAEDYRRNGVATALVKAAATLAGQLGHGRVYISTNVLGGHLLRNGWRLFGETRFLNDEPGSIFEFDLTASCHESA